MNPLGIVRRLGCVVIGATLMTLLTMFLQRNLPGYKIPLVTRAGFVLSLDYYFIGGTLGGIAAKLIYIRAGAVDSIIIGTFLPLLLLWASRQTTEHLPVMIGLCFAAAGSLGAYAGTVATKRFGPDDAPRHP